MRLRRRRSPPPGEIPTPGGPNEEGGPDSNARVVPDQQPPPQVPADPRRFTVRGRRRFPLTLLAAEDAWPASAHDARIIEASLTEPGDYELRLCTIRDRPEFARWAEHGWTVAEVEDWQPDETVALLAHYADGGQDTRRRW